MSIPLHAPIRLLPGIRSAAAAATVTVGIALARLFISEHTADTYVRAIRNRLGFDS